MNSIKAISVFSLLLSVVLCVGFAMALSKIQTIEGDVTLTNRSVETLKAGVDFVGEREDVTLNDFLAVEKLARDANNDVSMIKSTYESRIAELEARNAELGRRVEALEMKLANAVVTETGAIEGVAPAEVSAGGGGGFPQIPGLDPNTDPRAAFGEMLGNIFRGNLPGRGGQGGQGGASNPDQQFAAAQRMVQGFQGDTGVQLTEEQAQSLAKDIIAQVEEVRAERQSYEDRGMPVDEAMNRQIRDTARNNMDNRIVGYLDPLTAEKFKSWRNARGN
ncbi:MAG: hypothetical protein NUW37_05550 [Planctomycetes bacterium]|nr:hypothetical protein [Planctomycetota bacterium]